MIYSLFVIAFLALALSCSSLVDAAGTGSRKCRVTALSDVAGMSPVDGSGEGWVFTPSSTSYTPGEKLTFTITNTAAKTSFAGFLAFVEKPDATNTNINQVGTFTAKTGTTLTGNFPAPCNGASTAITHDSPAAKTLPYTLEWTAPAAGTGPVKARLAIVTTAGPFPFQFISVDLTEAAATTTTTAAPGTTTTAAGTTTTAAGTTTTARPNSAHQAGPVMMIIATMIAMGFAIMKIGF